MWLSVPLVKGVDVKHRTGSISQLMLPEKMVEGEWVLSDLSGVSGDKFVTNDGDEIYFFHKLPKPGQFPENGSVLVGAHSASGLDHLG